MKIRQSILLSIVYCLLSIVCYAIEIPLSGTATGGNVGYVDMNKVFESYSKVETVKREYEEKQKEKNEELELAEKEIKDTEIEIEKLKGEIAEIKNRISTLSQQIPQETIVDTTTIVGIQPSTTTPPTTLQETVVDTTTIVGIQPSTTTTLTTPSDKSALGAELDAKETELKEKQELVTKKRQEYDLKKMEVEKFLKEFEESKTLSIMGDLYVIIEELAKEENVSIVVEKASILYGLPNIDLTSKVIDRIRGK